VDDDVEIPEFFREILDAARRFAEAKVQRDVEFVAGFLAYGEARSEEWRERAARMITLGAGMIAPQPELTAVVN